jgi:hypothetical protein
MPSGMGGRWRAGQHSCPTVGCEWDDGRYKTGRLIGLASLVPGRRVGKSARATPEQAKPQQCGIRSKSFPRKTPQHNPIVHVPKTDTGGLV